MQQTIVFRNLPQPPQSLATIIPVSQQPLTLRRDPLLAKQKVTCQKLRSFLTSFLAIIVQLKYIHFFRHNAVAHVIDYSIA